MTTTQALEWWTRNKGRTESPANSNKVFVWDDIKRIYGANYSGQPWCGGAVLDACNAAGWKPPLDWVSVAAIEEWGKANKRWHSGASGIRASDVAVLFGYGVHTEQAMAGISSGAVKFGGGNTSQGGASSNGGAVCVQNRPTSQVRGYVRVDDLLDRNAPPKGDPPVTKSEMEQIAKMTADLVWKREGTTGWQPDGTYDGSKAYRVNAWGALLQAREWAMKAAKK